MFFKLIQRFRLPYDDSTVSAYKVGQAQPQAAENDREKNCQNSTTKGWVVHSQSWSGICDAAANLVCQWTPQRSQSHPPSIQCRFVIPCDSSASMTPSKISATPIAETKKPTIRVMASIPIGPNVFESLLA